MRGIIKSFKHRISANDSIDAICPVKDFTGAVQMTEGDEGGGLSE